MKKGFTLVELIAVIIIIGILGTIGYKNYSKVTSDTKGKQLLSQLDQIKLGMASYYNSLGTYPYDLSLLLKKPLDDGSGTYPPGYDAFTKAVEPGGTEDDTIVPYWGGPYLDNMVEDPDAPGCIKASVGGSICFGADIQDNSAFTSPGMLISSPLGTDNPSIDISSGSYASIGGVTAHYNVLSVSRITTQMAESIFESANGKAPLKLGNLQDVADGITPSSIGLPAGINYSGSNRLIFRYSDPY